MELKQYWSILWKRAWIPVLLLAVVGGVSLLTRQTPVSTYSTSMRFTVRVKPQVMKDEFTYEGYYGWLASEYLADDLTAIVNSQAFAADVNRHLAEMGSSAVIPSGIIGGVTFGEKQHRILRVNFSWGNEAELNQIAQAIVKAMEEDSAKYLTQPDVPGGAVITVIDEPSPAALNPPSLTQRLDLPVRLLLALAAGIALTFLLDYLDGSVRGKSELEAIGIPVLAEVPKKTR
jgi:capsular polysaccharide biosynthesis protein